MANQLIKIREGPKGLSQGFKMFSIKNGPASRVSLFVDSTSGDGGLTMIALSEEKKGGASTHIKL